jgi:ribonuclease P protein component
LTQTRFPRTSRLTRPSEYKKVFAKGRRHSGGCFVLLVTPNMLGIPRLGLVVPRRQESRAVDRNRVKRVVRESFRTCRGTLPPLDIVVMLRARAQDNQVLRTQLSQLWRKLEPS